MSARLSHRTRRWRPMACACWAGLLTCLRAGLPSMRWPPAHPTRLMLLGLLSLSLAWPGPGGPGGLSGTAHAQTAGATRMLSDSGVTRNLLVEVRQGLDASGSASGLDADGRVIISGGTAGADVRGGVLLRSLPGDATLSRSTTQQIRVLNGEHAAIRLGQTTPYTFYRVLWTADGPVIAPATVWQESSRGISVQPRWSGGNAPVVITLSAQTVATVSSMSRAERIIMQHQGQDPQGARTLRTLTTVEVPLGEWVTVAESSGEQSSTVSGALSTRSARSSERHVVQLRVTVP